MVDEIVKKERISVTFNARGGFGTIGAGVYCFYKLLFCGDGAGQGYLNPRQGSGGLQGMIRDSGSGTGKAKTIPALLPCLVQRVYLQNTSCHIINMRAAAS